MKIAILDIVKPQPGSGIGMTEYAYQLYERLRKKNKVTLIYPLEKARINDTSGLIYTFFLYKQLISKIANEDFDIIHITNQEIGFAAKILKKAGTRAKIVTTVHDIMRLEDVGYHKGLVQGTYSKLVASSIIEAMKYSDHIIFITDSVKNDSIKRFKLKSWSVIPLGNKEHFRTTPMTKKKGPKFNIGYIGALSYRKNVMFILKTAQLLKSQKDKYEFTIYGEGPERSKLMKYKEDNKLDNVRLMGFAKENELVTTYDSFDLFFYPTLEAGSSFPILEAQSRGLPVLIYKRNKMDEIVTKYAYVATDEKGALEIIKKISKNGYDKKQMKTVMMHARSFTWARTADKTVSVYKNLLKQGM